MWAVVFCPAPHAVHPGIERAIAGALDLWGCMWTVEERERFETAVVRTLIDRHPPRVRLAALALCHAIASPRLDAAALRVAGRGEFAAPSVLSVADSVRPIAQALAVAERLRGSLREIENLLARSVSGLLDAEGERVLDVIDVRDLVTVARTTALPRLYGEVERRLGARGRYQRARVRNALDFRVPEAYGSAA